ncbi:MAG: FHA domain-containing protein [Myxococcaceae bacterium]|nr:FHA domain-containing protein [Myxococcaceae bacterium]
MFNVATLRHLARSMSGEAFEARVGPFLLVRKPDAAQLARRMNGLSAQTVQVQRHGDQPQTRVLEFLIEFEDLEVLPATAGRTSWRIGRDTTCDFWIDDASVSKNHATIQLSLGGTYWLSDSGSTNGTWANEERITGFLEIPDGAVLSFGEATFWFVKAPTLYQHVVE